MSTVSFQQKSLARFTCRLIRDGIKSYINFSSVGQEGFYTALAESNVPLGLISNSYRRDWIQRHRRRKQKLLIKK